MQNSNSKDGTNVPTSTNADDTTSSQTIAKPNVGCSAFTISPEMPIGTELWIMFNNKPLLGLIAGYKVYVTSCTDENRGWHEQLFARWLNRKAKDVWTYSFQYEVKMDTYIGTVNLVDKNDKWFIWDKQVFFSIEELKASI